jgi:integrase
VRAALLDQKRRQTFGLTGEPPRDLEGHGPLVFTATDGGALSGTYVTHHFQKLLARAGLKPMRFHDLRHGTATLLLSQDVKIEEIARLLGHSTPATTWKTYAHVIDQAKRDAAAKLDGLFAETGS